MSKRPIEKNRLDIPWKEHALHDSDVQIKLATLAERSMIVGRVGLELMSCGTGAWRVRNSMNRVAKNLGMTCTVDIGLMSLNFTCSDGSDCVSQSFSLTKTGVNTFKLYRLEQFIKRFPRECSNFTVSSIHQKFDEFDKISSLYPPIILGLASALACCGFTFLLGGGLWEMLFAFVGAGCGNYVRAKFIKKHYTLIMNVAISVSVACFVYALLFRICNLTFGLAEVNQAGYICAMLFIIPGFPFITSGIDLAKLDLRSGLERLTYAIIIVLVATLSAWIMALILKLQPLAFAPLGLSNLQIFLFRLVASFCGVFGFSIMFNSSVKMAITAACIGMIANTLRLELVDFCNFPPALAAFCGAFTAGILASLLKKRVGYPRISITIPSIVIMVPGLYIYKGIYNLGTMMLSESASWLAAALLITLALPLGLVAARILTERSFRYSS